jgi:hypothetical protein
MMQRIQKIVRCDPPVDDYVCGRGLGKVEYKEKPK